MQVKYSYRRRLAYFRSLIWELYRDKLLVSVLATLIFGTLIFTLNHFFYHTRFWDSLPFQQGIEVYFCEYTDMNKLIRQPVNTFTNFIYMATAMFYFSKGVEDSRKKKAYNLITANPYYSITLGLIFFYTFLCSTFFHSSLVQLASDLDHSAVYSICLFPLMYFLHRVVLYWQNKPSNQKHKTEATILIIAFSLFYLLLTFVVGLHVSHELVLIIIALVLMFGTWLEIKDPGKTEKKYLLVTCVTIAFAIMFFAFDTRKIWCIPDSIVQPHSLWHLLNGISIFYFYQYIRSENYDPGFDLQKIKIRKTVFGEMFHTESS